MNIADLVRRMVAERVPREVVRPAPIEPNITAAGGLGDLTPAEEHTLYSDLLNEGDRCECGVCGCNNPILNPDRKPGV